VLPPERADAITRPRRSFRRIAIWATALVVLVAAVAGAITFWLGRGGKPSVQPECWVGSGPNRISLVDIDQAENATTITAVARQLGLPDHAVTVALAAALQESRLHNLHYGDRDSLGLFQQRPSQGWGTPAQLLDPEYAARAFFEALAKVPGWETLSVTTAAQAVQHSGAPDAYATWEPLARNFAIALTGEKPAGLTCQFAVERSTVPPPTVAPALTHLFGPGALGPPDSAAHGWTITAWLVAHARQYRIVSVRYAGREWTPRGAWSRTTDARAGIQIAQSAPNT
jgi:hypothetical protein